MAENLGLTGKSMRPKAVVDRTLRRGKVALMFLEMYTGLSSPKLMERVNGYIPYQHFCDVLM